MKHIPFEEPKFALITFSSTEVYCDISTGTKDTGDGSEEGWNENDT